MKLQMLRAALLASAGAAALTVPGFAFAQQDTAATTSQEELSEVVVTGSRIRRNDLTSIQPVQIISTENMDERGFTNVADALNELPSAGIPISPLGDQGSFGTGRNFVNLFNLGSNRTLTLVNGRRFVGGNPASIFTGAGAGGQVDLNVIPTGLVDRLEIVQAGGGAVYGSDAIAGVVNIITKTEFEGVEVDGLYGISDKGDGENWRARITAGRKFMDDRLSVAGSYEYNETTALAFTDRDVTGRQIAFANNPLNRTGSDLIAGAILIENRRIPEVTLGGLPFRTGGSALSGLLTIPDPSNPGARIAAQFDPNGNLVPYNSGTFYQASIASGGQGMNLAELSSLISPVKRHVATTFVHYDVTDNIRANVELFYSKLDAEEPFNQPIYNAPIFGGSSASLQFSTANPLLTPQARAAILAQPTALPADPNNPGERLFFLSRASTDIGSNKTTADAETWRGLVGLEGDFQAFDRDFFWNLSANQGQSKGSFSSPNVIQTRFLQAINVTRDASGTPVCADPAARAAGCAPLDLFGYGRPSQAALNYVQVQFESEFKLIQTVFEGNVGGDLFELPAGAVSFAAGFEYRREKSSFDPNEPQELGIGRSAAITAISGKYNTKEGYGEILVPVFGGDFGFLGMRRLEFEGSYRRIDHSQAGKDKAWSYGGRWEPLTGLMFRAQKSRSFRAPAITETSLPTATSFMTATDPCDARNINAGPNPATRLANCQAAFQALGLPSNFNLTSQVQASTVQGSQAGNPDLQNEIAKQFSVGFVWTPTFIRNFAVHADWVDIDLENAISNFNLTSILQVCYDSPSSPPDACGRFERGGAGTDAAGQILTAGAVGPGGVSVGPRTGYINAGYTNFEGLTAGLDWRLDLDTVGLDYLWGSNPGRIEFDLDVQHVKRQQTSVTGLGFDLNRDHGEIGYPKWSYKLETAYRRDALSVVWTVNWLDQSVFNNDFTRETRYPLTVDDYMVHDLAVSYDLTNLTKGVGLGLDRTRARFIVRNVGDVEPPYGTTGIGVYDVFGRMYQVGLTARF
ncbi:TonB-dependent receptor domain-containing protein [Phenylobacterium deserti]|uniref:TonB-dependent receptor domain-containing protein n=1 Tax=Phenylobacterium deserti TaxID=1914756 RepID=UPI0014041E01|nr:TonB-dependent receptor [Phenylobacterium deserti]